MKKYKPRHTVTMAMSKDLHNQLKKLAKSLDKSFSALMRSISMAELKRHNADVTPDTIQ